MEISTHTPLAGRDLSASVVAVFISAFLLTRPLRDVTSLNCVVAFHLKISTHTPLAGRDEYHLHDLYIEPDFYSHAPCGT